jgi:hypothetical protein
MIQAVVRFSEGGRLQVGKLALSTTKSGIFIVIARESHSGKNKMHTVQIETACRCGDGGETISPMFFYSLIQIQIAVRTSELNILARKTLVTWPNLAQGPQYPSIHPLPVGIPGRVHHKHPKKRD